MLRTLLSPPIEAAPRPPWSVTVSADLPACRQAWQALEARAIISPYQQYDFIAAWVRHAANGAGVAPLIGLVHDARGDLAALLPFGIRRGPFGRMAVYLGGKHVNFALPLADPALAPEPGSGPWTDIVQRYCRLAGADAAHLVNQPTQWNGTPHPFARLGWRQGAPNDGYLVTFPATFDAYLRSRASSRRLGSIRRCRRVLEREGVLFPGNQPARPDPAALVDAFCALKADQFRRRGMHDPFAEPGVADFLREAAEAGILDMQALTLDGVPIAVTGALPNGDNYALALMAFAQDHPLARYSPGELLMLATMEIAIADGFRTYDFGLGNVPYKTVWSTDLVQVFDSALAVSARGVAAVQFARAARAALGLVKRSPALMNLARRMQTLSGSDRSGLRQVP